MRGGNTGPPVFFPGEVVRVLTISRDDVPPLVGHCGAVSSYGRDHVRAVWEICVEFEQGLDPEDPESRVWCFDEIELASTGLKEVVVEPEGYEPARVPIDEAKDRTRDADLHSHTPAAPRFFPGEVVRVLTTSPDEVLPFIGHSGVVTSYDADDVGAVWQICVEFEPGLDPQEPERRKWLFDEIELESTGLKQVEEEYKVARVPIDETTDRTLASELWFGFSLSTDVRTQAEARGVAERAVEALRALAPLKRTELRLNRHHEDPRIIEIDLRTQTEINPRVALKTVLRSALSGWWGSEGEIDQPFSWDYATGWERGNADPCEVFLVPEVEVAVAGVTDFDDPDAVI